MTTKEIAGMLNDLKLEITKAIKESKEELKNEIKEVKGRMTNLERENDEIKNEVSILWNENEHLKARIHHLEEYSRIDNVVIHGIKEEENETEEELIEQIEEIGKSLGVQIQLSDIKVAHRLPTSKKENRHRPVIVRMNNRMKKEKLIQRSKECRLQNIYIDRHHTKETTALLNEAKAGRKEGAFKYAWINRRGQVMIRTKENTPSIKILNSEHLQELMNPREEGGVQTRRMTTRAEEGNRNNLVTNETQNAKNKK